jgi:hypothetical protein
MFYIEKIDSQLIPMLRLSKQWGPPPFSGQQRLMIAAINLHSRMIPKVSRCPLHILSLSNGGAFYFLLVGDSVGEAIF